MTYVSPGVSRRDSPAMVIVIAPARRRPTCSLGWWCSRTTRLGSRSITANVSRSPRTARATAPSQIPYGRRLLRLSNAPIASEPAVDDRGGAQAAAAAHRLQAVAEVAALELVEQVAHQAGAGRAERVPDRDG